MSSYLKSQQIKHEFLVVNQTDTHRFNRGQLINVGYLECDPSYIDYMAMHDVDLLPLNRQELKYLYPSRGPIHIASPSYHPLYTYPKYVGGILLITLQHFRQVNGMSTDYWGWGQEDDNFFVRLRLAELSIYRPSNLTLTNRTNTFRHLHNSSSDKAHKRDNVRYGLQRQHNLKLHLDKGLNTTKYELVDRYQITVDGDEDIVCTVLNVKLECDFQETPWCDHPSSINESIRVAL
ncbi:unnamed protein product [Didymodactylos carnosus]|uniref:Beta-1,4-galactosyltransferase 7 n=1 Tax=Didymodactylos carnosus TaxID=1234261 RepID=A0A816C2I6_9BILA|nr:unnamed protein product [Didymodactylos carnosus]CAF4507865.1 unnamed protein product [Didymodactylos carnosus]